MRIILVDDHPIFLDSVRMQLMRAFRHAEIVALPTYAALKAELAKTKADLIMVDYSMPPDELALSGAAAVAMVVEAAAGAPVLVMSGVAIGKDVMRCLSNGASAFLPKTLDGRLLTMMIWLLIGERLGEAPPQRVVSTRPGASSLSGLTLLDQQILDLFLDRMPMSDIASQAKVKEASVPLYVLRSLGKLGIVLPDGDQGLALDRLRSARSI